MNEYSKSTFKAHLKVISTFKIRLRYPTSTSPDVSDIEYGLANIVCSTADCVVTVEVEQSLGRRALSEADSETSVDYTGTMEETDPSTINAPALTVGQIKNAFNVSSAEITQEPIVGIILVNVAITSDGSSTVNSTIVEAAVANALGIDSTAVTSDAPAPPAAAPPPSLPSPPSSPVVSPSTSESLLWLRVMAVCVVLLLLLVLLVCVYSCVVTPNDVATLKINPFCARVEDDYVCDDRQSRFLVHLRARCDPHDRVGASVHVNKGGKVRSEQ